MNEGAGSQDVLRDKVSPSKAVPPRSCPLMDISAEILNMIAHELIEESTVRFTLRLVGPRTATARLIKVSPSAVSVQFTQREPGELGLFRNGFALLRANKRCFTELSALLYGKITFIFDIYQAFEKFFAHSARMRPFIRSVGFNFVAGKYNEKRLCRMLGEMTALRQLDLVFIHEQPSGRFEPIYEEMFRRVARDHKAAMGPSYDRSNVSKALGLHAGKRREQGAGRDWVVAAIKKAEIKLQNRVMAFLEEEGL